MKGRNHDWGDKIGKSLKGYKHILKTKNKIKDKAFGREAWNKGMRKCTHPELAKCGHSGDKHWNWKGGVSDNNVRIRQSSEYKNWRYSVFVRDKFTCKVCGQVGGSLEAHHIKSFTDYPEYRFEIDNGITYCKECHKSKHKVKNKGDRDGNTCNIQGCDEINTSETKE